MQSCWFWNLCIHLLTKKIYLQSLIRHTFSILHLQINSSKYLCYIVNKNMLYKAFLKLFLNARWYAKLIRICLCYVKEKGWELLPYPMYRRYWTRICSSQFSWPIGIYGICLCKKLNLEISVWPHCLQRCHDLLWMCNVKRKNETKEMRKIEQLSFFRPKPWILQYKKVIYLF